MKSLSVIFAPIAPTNKIDCVAVAIAPGAEQRVIGGRPGEKVHEAMFSITEAPLVARRGRHYIVIPVRGRWTLADYCAQVE